MLNPQLPSKPKSCLIIPIAHSDPFRTEKKSPKKTTDKQFLRAFLTCPLNSCRLEMNSPTCKRSVCRLELQKGRRIWFLGTSAVVHESFYNVLSMIRMGGSCNMLTYQNRFGLVVLSFAFNLRSLFCWVLCGQGCGQIPQCFHPDIQLSRPISQTTFSPRLKPARNTAGLWKRLWMC